MRLPLPYSVHRDFRKNTDEIYRFLESTFPAVVVRPVTIRRTWWGAYYFEAKWSVGRHFPATNIHYRKNQLILEANLRALDCVVPRGVLINIKHWNRVVCDSLYKRQKVNRGLNKFNLTWES